VDEGPQAKQPTASNSERSNIAPTLPRESPALGPRRPATRSP
jgi:hypothetical protein